MKHQREELCSNTIYGFVRSCLVLTSFSARIFCVYLITMNHQSNWNATNVLINNETFRVCVFLCSRTSICTHFALQMWPDQKAFPQISMVAMCKCETTSYQSRLEWKQQVNFRHSCATKTTLPKFSRDGYTTMSQWKIHRRISFIFVSCMPKHIPFSAAVRRVHKRIRLILSMW